MLILSIKLEMELFMNMGWDCNNEDSRVGIKSSEPNLAPADLSLSLDHGKILMRDI